MDSVTRDSKNARPAPNWQGTNLFGAGLEHLKWGLSQTFLTRFLSGWVWVNLLCLDSSHLIRYLYNNFLKYKNIKEKTNI